MALALSMLLAGCLGPVPEPPSGALLELLGAGSPWRYLDDGSEPDAGWTAVDFDDEAWPEGRALLGYGAGDESTVMRCHPAVAAGEPCPQGQRDRTLAYFLRRAFEVENPERFSRLRLRLLKDDGAIVYLNGEMVARANMRPGVLGQGQAAASETDDPRAFREYRFDHRKLRAGGNVLAVELHQASAKGKSVGFDLELVGFDPAATAIRRGPYLQMLTAGGATLRWSTGDAVSSEVRWGEDPQKLDRVLLDPELKNEHKMRLENLEPSTLYYYRVGAGERRLGSELHRLRTAPEAGAGETRVWVTGGLGTADRFAQKTMLALGRWSLDRGADAWLTVGGSALERGSEQRFDDALFTPFRPVLAQIPLWPAIGNSEMRTGKGPDTTPFFRLFNLPSQGQAGGTPSLSEAYYSFDHGDVHFVCLDTVAGNLSPDKEMLTWLKEDLESHDRPWTIAYFHHPPYSGGWLSSDDAEKSGRSFGVRQSVVPILEAAGVDVVIAGKNPSYERSFLLRGHLGTSDTLEPGMILDSGDGREDGEGPYRKARRGPGTLYVVTGGAARSVKTDFAHPAMAAATERRGAVVIDVAGSRLDLRYLTADGEVFDHVTLLQR
ncbi:MAG: fibronectin type III domain-containing protein [Acidobacteriota bacterium]